MRAGAAAERLDEIGELLVRGELVARGAGDVQDLAAQRQDRLGRAVARLLGRAAGGIALDDEEFRALRRMCSSSRRACRAGAACGVAVLRATSFSARRRSRSSARSIVQSSSFAACDGEAASQ